MAWSHLRNSWGQPRSHLCVRLASGEVTSRPPAHYLNANSRPFQNMVRQLQGDMWLRLHVGGCTGCTAARVAAAA
jgi:hypothetical protein